MELGKRKELILSAIVESFIESGEPIGSKMLMQLLPISVSSATIRNEMSELAEMGFLEQPHTSAGRIPTQAGYRYYVDNLMKDICAEFSDVYFIDTPNQTGTDMLTSADGVHPCSWGYKRWADAIQPKVVEILATYNIK